MSSYFAFSRPRNIKGNYIVQVSLSLLPTEEGQVWVARNRGHHCGKCGKQVPGKTKALLVQGVKRQEEYYLIDDIIAGDQITIEIKDKQVVPTQETRHTATMQGFTHDILPFVHPRIGNRGYWTTPTSDDVWDDVYLNKILVYDLDYSNSKPQFSLCDPNKRPLVLPNVPRVVVSPENTPTGQMQALPSSTPAWLENLQAQQYMLPQDAQSLRQFEEFLYQQTGMRFHFHDGSQVVVHNHPPQNNPKNRGF
jgi:hypothetical protein